MGRPQFEPTDEQRKFVKAMAAYGASQNEICGVLEISAPTLRLHFARELMTGATEANAKVAESLFLRATSKDAPQAVTAAIFWLKARAGWREADAAPPGKKEQAEASAATAGQTSEWGDDLTYAGDRPN